MIILFFSFRVFSSNNKFLEPFTVFVVVVLLLLLLLLLSITFGGFVPCSSQKSNASSPRGCRIRIISADLRPVHGTDFLRRFHGSNVRSRAVKLDHTRAIVLDRRCVLNAIISRKLCVDINIIYSNMNESRHAPYILYPKAQSSSLPLLLLFMSYCSTNGLEYISR